jgi:hypothetical protein
MNTRDRAAQAEKWEWFEGMHTGDALVVSVRVDALIGCLEAVP